MQREKGFNVLIVALSVAALATFTVTAIAADVPRMTKEELKGQLGKADVVIVDVRIGKDWKASEFKIKGAVRGDPSDVDSWMTKHPKDKTLVLYCA